MAQHQSPGFFSRHNNIYLYVPNLIGYGRVAFAAYAFAVARRSPGAMIVAYLLSFVCDELDGRMARLLGQTSTLGQVLDMVTDRVATTCLLGTLGALWPPALLPCLLLIALDIASHWFQMYATLAAGASTHKDVRSRSAVVRFYYRSRVFMGFCCVCCEVLYLALYALTWPQYRTWGMLPLPLVLSQALAHTGLAIGHEMAPAGLSAAAVIALAALPGTIIKQVVNVIQLRNAMGTLVRLDLERRG